MPHQSLARLQHRTKHQIAVKKFRLSHDLVDKLVVVLSREAIHHLLRGRNYYVNAYKEATKLRTSEIHCSQFQ